MQISKENIFKRQYSAIIGQVQKKKKTSKLIELIREHKIIAISILVFFLTLILNLTLIYNFLKILQSIR